MADADELLMGRIGRELLGTGQLLLLIFIMTSHILTFSVLMNTLTNHGTCTIVFAVVGTLVSFVGALPRTMDKVYWISVACLFTPPQGSYGANHKNSFCEHSRCNNGENGGYWCSGYGT
jgi:hypothetical protein